jgi:glycosyltransferase involved in cell wall biosynthesis
MKASLLVTTFNRDELLNLTAPSIVKQDLSDIEVIIINDGIPGETEELCEVYGFKYLFTGHRNLGGKMHWRIPGFAINVAAKQAQGDIIIISCAEMLHLNQCINLLTTPFESTDAIITIPEGRQDFQSKYLDHYKKHHSHSEDIYTNGCCKLKVKLPFLMGIKRQTFLDIGGYDEDFIGQAFDDNDLVDRLVTLGLEYYPTKAKTVHLHHSRRLPGREFDNTQRWQYNRKLYENRKGQGLRNQGRVWGLG